MHSQFLSCYICRSKSDINKMCWLVIFIYIKMEFDVLNDILSDTCFKLFSNKPIYNFRK